MVRSASSLLVMVAALLLCIGCESVETTVLIGERVTQNLDEWSGVWQAEDNEGGVIFLKDESDGVLHAAAVSWEDGVFKLHQFKCTVTALGERRYVHLPGDDSDRGADDGEDADKEPRFGFMLIEQPEPGVLRVAGSIPSAFREAVEAGELEGEVTRQQVARPAPNGNGVAPAEGGKQRVLQARTILRDKASLDAFLLRTPHDRLFDVEKPIRLRRIAPLECAGEEKNANGD